MRLAFMGTSEFAVPSLQGLVSAGHDIPAVFTQPDRPSGRGRKLKMPPVKEKALEAGLTVHQPETLRTPPFRALIEGLEPEIIVVVAYGKILPPWLVDLPAGGVVNLHGSLLPKYRGAAPIHWAVMNGDIQTGVCTMRMDHGLDSGPVYRCVETRIGPEETSTELSRRLAEMGVPLLLETLESIARGAIEPQPQDESQVTTAPRLTREMGYIRWEEPARSIHDKIRGLQPWPGVVVEFRAQRCRIREAGPVERTPAGGRPGAIRLDGFRLMVSCGDGGWIELRTLQMENRRAVSGAEFANGVRIEPGERFTSVGHSGPDPGPERV